jgi:hypothetical protein
MTPTPRATSYHRERSMKARRMTPLAVVAFLLFRGVASADIIEDFRFNDVNGTALNQAVNSANPGNQWIHDNDHPASIQVLNGSLNIVKNNTDFVTEGLGLADVSSGILWMVAEFEGWAVLGTAPDGNNVEEIRFGFMGSEDLVPPPSSVVLAEMMLARDFDSNTFQISGTALGAGGTNIAPATINLIQTDPFMMAMQVDQDTNTYRIYYKDGANSVILLGTGNLEPTRDALIVRMAINNFWGTNIGGIGEHANLDRFYISDESPFEVPAVPEPSSWALGLVAVAGWMARRRSSSV